MNAVGFTLSALDLAVVVASLALVVAVGVWAGKGQNESARGYFLASDRLRWWIIGSAFVSTSVSSEQIVGTIGAAYQHGMAIANWEWWCLPTYVLLLVFFIPVYLRNRIATAPEYLSRRFGPLCSDLYSWVMLAAYVLVFQVPVLYGSSLVLSQLTGWHFQAVLWGTVVLVGLYTVKGGLASVMWTDAVQCVMLLGGGVVLFFVALGKIPGGWAAMESANPQRFHLYHPPGDPNAPFLGLITGSLGVFLFYQASNQVMIQRILAARSTWDGLMGVIFAGFINLLRPLATCFLGLIVYHWTVQLKKSPPLSNPDLAFPLALNEFTSGYGLRGVILAGFLAAVMSTVSALANSTATIFALDIYRRILRPEAADREVVRAGQIASLIALAAAALICPAVASLGGIFRYFQTGVTMLATPFVSVFLMGILWWRVTYPAALFGMIGGIVIQCAVAFGLPLLGVSLHWLYVGFIAQVLVMAGVAAVSLATPAPDRAAIGDLVWRPGLFRASLTSQPRRWYQTVPFWFTVYAILWFGLYWWFW